MPHPESEHGLRVQLATALRERDEARGAQQVQMAAVLHTIGGEVGGHPTGAHNYLQRLRALVAEKWKCSLCGVSGPKTLEAMNEHLLSCVHRPQDATEEALAAANARADAAEADRNAWHRTADIRGALLAGNDAPFRKEIANAEAECAQLREAMLQLRVRDEPDCWCPPRFGRDIKDDEHTTACMMARAALSAPASATGEDSK